MKNSIYIIICTFTFLFSNAQVTIGGKPTLEGTSTILDFNSDVNGNVVVGTGANTKGIILPPVSTLPVYTITPGQSSANNGTFVYDQTNQRVKMFENNVWVDLSGVGSNTQIINNNSADTANSRVIIGSTSSNAAGVLVLESPNKAMILPRIANPHTAVKNPYPGMMCYDTVGKVMAVYDGTNWNYWR